MKKTSAQFQKEIYSKEPAERNIEIKDIVLFRAISSSLETGGKILDIGCGDGIVLKPLSDQCDCYGVDVSRTGLRVAKSRGINSCQIDIENGFLPFCEKSFDLVVCSETIEHLIGINNLFCEIRRVLKDDGVFVLTFPNVNQPASWLMQIFCDLPPRFSARYASPHLRDYTLRIVSKILTQCFSFQITEVRGTYVYPSKGVFSRWVAAVFPRFAEKIVITSKKTVSSKDITCKDTTIWNIRDF